MSRLDEKEIDEICRFYVGNNMKEIRRICDKIFSSTNIPKGYLDDYYGKAVEILVESIKTYDKSKKCKFNTYYYGNLIRRRETWKRDNFRFKRCNLETDKKGKIKRDNKGNPVIITDISIHMKVNPEEDLSYKQQKAVDLICSGYSQEEILKELHMTEREYRDKILGSMQRYENVKILLRK